jgi:hypothetical protein
MLGKDPWVQKPITQVLLLNKVPHVLCLDWCNPKNVLSSQWVAG